MYGQDRMLEEVPGTKNPPVVFSELSNEKITTTTCSVMY
jgi:hypothetical protein